MVEILRFDGTTGGEVVLAARWSLAAADGRELMLHKARYSAPIGAPNYEATVTAMGHTLAALSRDIAATVQRIATQPSTR
jgi:uncharacterized lipoprotein YmbA